MITTWEGMKILKIDIKIPLMIITFVMKIKKIFKETFIHKEYRIPIIVFLFY